MLPASLTCRVRRLDLAEEAFALGNTDHIVTHTVTVVTMQSCAMNA